MWTYIKGQKQPSFYFINFCTNWISKVFPLSNVNEAVRYNKFPDSLKLPVITSAYKKIDLSDKTKYRPVSVLPLLWIVFEKIIYG